MSPDDPLREPDQIPGVALPEDRLQVLGHDDVRQSLNDQIAARRVPGALLLHGPRGIGKATLAFDFARALLAATGDETARRVADQIAAGVHPNVFVLRRTLNKTGSNFSSNILIDQVSQRKNSVSEPLIERLHRTRGRAGYRVCVVDSIDDCNQSATNALLKIIEEPPPETVFVLVSHRPGALLPTIRSRCHAHALRPLDIAAVRQLLLPEADGTSRVENAVELSGGSPRRAFEILHLDSTEAIDGLRSWLSGAGHETASAHLQLAGQLSAASETEKMLGRELIRDYLANEARTAATQTTSQANRLASASHLWEKANQIFANADIFNLDARQTLVGVFDDIREHATKYVRPMTGMR